MGRRADEGAGAGSGQRRVGRNMVLFTIPLILLTLLSALLVWEVVRLNLSASDRRDWPWRLSLLDLQSVSNMLALTAGVAFARAQYARSARPQIGWSGAPDDNTYGMAGSKVWVVQALNGGTHSATVESVAYRIEWMTTDSTGRRLQTDWITGEAAISELMRGHPSDPAGEQLANGRDFYLNTIGYGGQLGTIDVGRFSMRLVDRLHIELRLRVADAAGDRHERVLCCLKGAKGEMRSALVAEAAAGQGAGLEAVG
ncbi:hypothetical protein ACM614_00130, partial [Streptomyces sp. 12297]